MRPMWAQSHRSIVQTPSGAVVLTRRRIKRQLRLCRSFVGHCKECIEIRTHRAFLPQFRSDRPVLPIQNEDFQEPEGGEGKTLHDQGRMIRSAAKYTDCVIGLGSPVGL